jgi:hypothetical protein
MKKNRRLRLLIGITLGTFILLAFLAGLFPITATSTTLTDVMEPQLKDQIAFTDSATPDPIVLLPLLRRDPTPTPTLPPQSILLNGGFEQGPVVWVEYSSNGWRLILRDIHLPVPPHSGSWAAWLGGDFNEASILSQQIYLAPGDTTLRYRHWIASQDICDPDYDIAGVLINDTAVDAFLLCEPENTNGWSVRIVDLSAYAGQSVTIHFAAFTDGSLNSNLFLDDISLDSTAQEVPEMTLKATDDTITKHVNLGQGAVSEEEVKPYGDYRMAISEYIGADPTHQRVEKK